MNWLEKATWKYKGPNVQLYSFYYDLVQVCCMKLKTCQHFLFNISFACRGLQNIAYFWLMSGKIFVILVTTDTIFCHATLNSHVTGCWFLLKVPVFLKQLMYSNCYYFPPLNFSEFKFISNMVAIYPNYYAAKMSLHYYIWIVIQWNPGFLNPQFLQPICTYFLKQKSFPLGLLHCYFSPDLSKNHFLGPIFVSLGGLRNPVSTLHVHWSYVFLSLLSIQSKLCAKFVVILKFID